MNILLKPQAERHQLGPLAPAARDVERAPLIAHNPESIAHSCSGNNDLFSATDMPAVRVADLLISSNTFHVIAGPCSVETEEQTLAAARAVKASGATILRGGAFKPRTSPYDFDGLGKAGLEILKKARQETGLPIVTEVMSPGDVEMIAEAADMLQIGSRNAQNFPLLRAVGRQPKPVFLKRGLGCTWDEWIEAAEVVAAQGNSQIILCERGIRTFETSTRFTLDLTAVPMLKAKTHLPVFVDPSHGVGRADLILPLARAAVAVGCDGLMIEVHSDPKHALSDSYQQLTPSEFEELMASIRPMVELMGRRLGEKWPPSRLQRIA
jgi:3-deoxy-7-phosphoheptulonate synthase